MVLPSLNPWSPFNRNGSTISYEVKNLLCMHFNWLYDWPKDGENCKSLGKDLKLDVGVNKPNGDEFRFNGDLRRLKLAVGGAETELGDTSGLRLTMVELFPPYPRISAITWIAIMYTKGTYFAWFIKGDWKVFYSVYLFFNQLWGVLTKKVDFFGSGFCSSESKLSLRFTVSTGILVSSVSFSSSLFGWVKFNIIVWYCNYDILNNTLKVMVGNSSSSSENSSKAFKSASVGARIDDKSSSRDNAIADLCSAFHDIYFLKFHSSKTKGFKNKRRV